MRWNKSTSLALYAAVEMARSDDAPVTAAAVAAKHHVSVHHLSKVLQRLARAGVARTVLGTKGGYLLARSAKDVSVAEIVEIFEGPVDFSRCMMNDGRRPCDERADCRIKRLFDEVERQAHFTLRSTRLSMLV